MSALPQRTITIRYTPATRSVVYERRDKQLSPSEVHLLLRTLNRTRISTLAPTRPKGGEIYVFRSRIIGKSWRNDGYERCWRSNGSHYYPKCGNVQLSKQNAAFKIIRHVAFDRDADNADRKRDFRRVAFLELNRAGKDNPLVVVQYYGDESSCTGMDRPHGNTTHGQSKHRSTKRKTLHRPLTEAATDGEEVVHLMDIGPDATASIVSTPSAAASASAPVNTSAGATALDEDLREASALGDLDRVAVLLARGAGINSANRVNGWTALHWAAKRGHAQVASLLLGHGADPAAANLAGQTPKELAGSEKLLKMLGGAATTATAGRHSGEFVPNYLRNPEFPYSARTSAPPAAAAAAAGATSSSPEQRHQLPVRRPQTSPERGRRRDRDGGADYGGPLLLQARVANSDDPDFIEVELSDLTYCNLLELLCQELSLEPDSVERIRKLPNVRLRNDRDIVRLEYGQQLELVLRDY